MSTPFFTMLEKYFHCCMCRCCIHKHDEEETSSNSSYRYNAYSGNGTPGTQCSFDDMSNPSTPITWSSSSSLDSFNYPNELYKRKSMIISIIPQSYHSD